MDCDDIFEDEEDFEEESGRQEEMIYLVRVTLQQIEQLLSLGRVDIEQIDVECLDCSNEITVHPTLILDN